MRDPRETAPRTQRLPCDRAPSERERRPSGRMASMPGWCREEKAASRRPLPWPDETVQNLGGLRCCAERTASPSPGRATAACPLGGRSPTPTSCTSTVPSAPAGSTKARPSSRSRFAAIGPVRSTPRFWTVSEPVAQSRPGRHLPRRCRGHRHAGTERCLITPSPNSRHSSWVGLRQIDQPGTGKRPAPGF